MKGCTRTMRSGSLAGPRQATNLQSGLTCETGLLGIMTNLCVPPLDFPSINAPGDKEAGRSSKFGAHGSCGGGGTCC